MTGQPALEKSYQAALHIMEHRAVSFYGAFRLLPRDRFHAVAAVYAFCRSADDIADHVMEDEATDASRALAQLAVLEDMVRGIFEQRDTATSACAQADWPWAAALKDTVRRFQPPIDPFLWQLKGQRWDIGFTGFQTLGQLMDYARLVAGSVGVMLLSLLARDSDAARLPALQQACENLGIAMQLTNILRDVGEDLRLRSRLYLPLELLKQHGVQPDELMQLAHHEGTEPPGIPDGFVQLWEHMALAAEPLYQQIETQLCCFHPACRKPLLAAAYSYRAIADAVRQHGYNCFTTRCYTSQAQRQAIYQQVEGILSGLNC